MPRREIPLSVKRLDTFEQFGRMLSARRTIKGLSQQDMGNKVGDGVNQSTISRIERGRMNLSWSLAKDVIHAYGVDRQNEQEWLGRLFGVVSAIHPDEIDSVSIQLDFHVHRGVMENPKNSYYFGNLVGNMLEDKIHKDINGVNRSIIQYLAKKARLIEAWGRICSSPKTEYSASIELIKSTIEGYEDNHEIYHLGMLLLTSTENMLAERAVNIDELERFISQARVEGSYVVALLYEELAKQYMLSPEYHMDEITAVLDKGKQYCYRSPSLKSHILRLESVRARATFEKGGDPLQAAALMRGITRQLRLPGPANPSLLVEALGLGASMQLHAGKRTRESAMMLREGYKWAEYTGNRYSMEWLVREANKFGLPLRSVP